MTTRTVRLTRYFVPLGRICIKPGETVSLRAAMQRIEYLKWLVVTCNLPKSLVVNLFLAGVNMKLTLDNTRFGATFRFDEVLLTPGEQLLVQCKNNGTEDLFVGAMLSAP